MTLLGPVRVYGKLLQNYPHPVNPDRAVPCPPSCSLFFIDLILESFLSVSGSCGVQLLPGSCLMDMEYADDIVILGSDPSEIQLL